ncbi:MAG TPA: hypothetical protein PKL31_18370 [Fulvivirga sp.]|nr:hypothetical protein [Fulvivirga sp.]
MLKPSLLFLIFLPILSFAQIDQEAARITELYDLIDNKAALFGTEALIYDYKLKGRKVLKDSTMVARISIVDNHDKPKEYGYDTTNLTVIKYEISNTGKQPVLKLTHDAQMHVIESAVVNEQMEELSKTFYKYDNDLLVSEEAYTGYSYLDNPRNFSRIDYKYKDGQLVEKDKKYSLNGTHWIQTWLTRYNEKGDVIYLEETNEDNTVIYNYTYENNTLIKCLINDPENKKSVKEIVYNKVGYPVSVYWYIQKNKKPLRLTKYFYKK